MPYARLHDPATSKEAARSVRTTTVKDIQASIRFVMAFCPKGLIDERLFELVQEMEGKPLSPSSVRTRRRELCDKGIIRAAPDRKGRTSSGRACHIWELAPQQQLPWK